MKSTYSYGQIVKIWPKYTLLIIGTKFLEGVSSMCFIAVLTLYLINVLQYSNNDATVIYTCWNSLTSLAPLFGSILADGFIGKFSTIVILYITNALGVALLTFDSTLIYSARIQPFLGLLALFIMSMARGGYNANVMPFGADQFRADQVFMQTLFISALYFTQNFGGLVGSFIAPILRSQTCLDQENCYPLTFGVSTVLMVVSTSLFISGSFWYKTPKPQGNVLFDVAKVIRGSYLKNHICSEDQKCIQLQTRKSDKTLCSRKQFIEDIKSLKHVIIMYIPCIMFFALYDQQGSVWVIQGLQMVSRLWGDTMLLPDQMYSSNMLLIIIFIPILQGVIYPMVNKVVKLTILRKMVFGGYLAMIGFVVAGIVQIFVNKSSPALPPISHSYISFTNGFDSCNLTIMQSDDPKNVKYLSHNTSLENLDHDKINTFDIVGNLATFNISYENVPENSDCDLDYLPKYINYTIENDKIYNIYVSPNGAYLSEAKSAKPTEGNGGFKLSINLALEDFNYQGNLAICRKNTEGTSEEHPCDPRRSNDFYFYETSYNNGKDSDLVAVKNYTTTKDVPDERLATIYDFKSIRPGTWRIFYMKENAKSIGQKTLTKEEVHVNDTGIEFEMEKEGGVYVMFIRGSTKQPKFTLFQVSPDNTISIAWQLPQYAIVAFAEMLFTISAQEFAYTQAPKSMKSIVYSLFLLSIAIGDGIIIVIAAWNIFKDLAMQNFVYAGAMFVVITIFMILSMFYEYRNYGGDKEEPKELPEKETMQEAIY